jgi:hypothetical protein
MTSVIHARFPSDSDYVELTLVVSPPRAAVSLFSGALPSQVSPKGLGESRVQYHKVLDEPERQA